MLPVLHDRIFLAKTLVALSSAVLPLLVLRLSAPWIEKRATGPASALSTLRLGAAVVALLHAVLFVVGSFVLHLRPQGDVAGVYTDEANLVLAGGLPYRDFHTAYGPFNALLDGALFHLWHDTRILILLSLLAEIAVTFLWAAYVAEEAEHAAPEHRAGIIRRGFATLLLIAVCSFSILEVPIDGTNNPLGALFLAGSLILAARRRDLSSGIVFALGLFVVKVVPILLLPLLFFAARKPLRLLAGFVATSAASIALLFAAHMTRLWWVGFSLEAQQRTASNLPFLSTAILGFDLPRQLWQAVTLLCLGSCLVLFCRRLWTLRSGRVPVLSMAGAMIAIMSIFLLLSPKGWPAYFILLQFPLYWLIAGQRPWTRWALLAGQAFFLIVPSFWFRMTGTLPAIEIHGLLRHGNTGALVLALTMSLMLATYVAQIVVGSRDLLRTTHSDPLL